MDFIANHRRTAIRRYLIQLITDTVDLKGKVFPNRPSPIFLKEVPCCLIYFESEPAQVIVGDTYNPKQLQRDLRVNIDFLMDEIINPELAGDNINQDTEDQLDFYSWQAEQAIFDDWRLIKLLPSDHILKKVGLSLGGRLVNCDPYNIDTGSDRRIVAQRNQFEIPYDSDTYKDLKYDDFKAYQADIKRVGFDENTVDPTLLGAEGTI